MRSTIRTAGLVFASLVPAALAGCGNGAAEPAVQAPASAPASPAVVEVVRPQQKSLRRVVEQPGTIQAYEETQLFARVPGYVSKVLFDIGQKVRGPKVEPSGKEVEPGEVLAEISVPEMEEEANQKKALVRQAQAEVEQANKALASAEAHITTTRASVDEARANHKRWASEVVRIAQMVQKGAVDKQTHAETLNQTEAAEARVLSTEAAVTKATADRDKAQADVQAAVARVDVARAEARRLEALLTYAKIRAPFDGVVTRRKVNTGDLVQPGGKGDWLFTVARLDPVRVVIDVPEADAAMVREKSAVSLSIPALRIPAFATALTRTSWALTPGARTLRAEIDVPNKDGRLRPGMYVYAHITGELPAAWTLPASALVKQGDTMVCYRVEGGKVLRTAVQLGRSDGQFTEVLKLQKPAGSTSWVDWTGKEEVAARVAGLTDGQAVQSGPGGT